MQDRHLTRYVISFAGCIFTAMFLWYPPGARSDMDVGDIAVIETDATIIPEAFDLDNLTLEFSPNGDAGYDVTLIPFTFENDIGANLGLADDASIQQVFSFTFPFFGVAQSSVFISANGFVNFGSPSTLVSESLQAFASNSPRIAALWDDLDPSTGGTVHFNDLGNRAVVTWQEVPEFNASNTNTFQVVLFNTGTIRMSYNGVVIQDGLVGVAPGATSAFLGTSVDFTAGPTSSVETGFTGSRLIAQVFADPTDPSFVPFLPIQAVARKFYQTHPDDFDQLVLMTDFEHSMGTAFAFELPINQTVQGIGLPLFEFTEAYGSTGRLQSVLNMNRLDLYPADPNADFLGTNNTLDLMGQESGHQWLAFALFDDGGINSDALLGRDTAHWSFFLDADASDMEGNNWLDNGNDTFTTNEATERFSSLDQYIMGLRSPAEVPDFFFITNPNLADPCGTGFGPGCPPEIGVTVSGTRQDVGVDQVIDATGARHPAAGFSTANPTNVHRQGFILLTQPGTSAPSTPSRVDSISKWDGIRSAWVSYFATATENRGTIETNLGTAIGNQPPIANAGADQSVNEGSVVPLNGSSSSDPDGDPVTFAWTQTAGPRVTLSNPSTVSPTFTAPAVTATTGLTFQLVVNDGTANSLPDTVDIMVNDITANLPPIANAGTDQSVNEGSVVPLNGSSSSDPDGDPVTFAWTQTAGPRVTLSNPSTVSPTFTAPAVTATTGLTFQLVVNDGTVNSAPDAVDITVNDGTVVPPNQVPVANAGTDQSVDEGSVVPLNGSGSSDPDGDPVTFAWTQTAGPRVTLSNPSTVSPTFTAPAVTATTGLTFQLVVNDGTVNSPPNTVGVTVLQVFRGSTPEDLENLVFPFSDGMAFSQALANTSVTLTIEEIDSALTGPFTLEWTGNTATGTVTVASCNLSIHTNTFASGTFPGLRSGLTIPLDPCEVNVNNGTLRVQNTVTGAISTSAVPTVFMQSAKRGGGGCTINPGARFDCTLVGLMFIMAACLTWRRIAASMH